jgi:hypothetical protein
MASKDKNTGQNLNIESAVFNKGMMMDFDDLIVPEGVWIRARNAVNNSQNGNIGVIGNEPSNQLCQTISYTVIGLIYISDGVWAVFSTDDQNHQIGIYREDSCSYTAIHTELVGRKGCLNFRRTNLIKGVSRERFDCTRQLYWDDGFNTSRTIALRQDLTRFTDEYYVRTITNQQTGEDADEDCEIPIYDYTTLNCENLRLNPLFNPPCIKLKRASYSGTLLNGTYQVAIAYAIDGQKVTDYIALSNPQSLYKH